MNNSEIEARDFLVKLARAMLNGTLSYFEGAVQVLALRRKLGGIGAGDSDFGVFLLIQSETDHLPLESQRSLWSAAALAELEPEFRRTEEWAAAFAPQACRNLIARFEG